jgi:hypothetical protein
MRFPVTNPFETGVMAANPPTAFTVTTEPFAVITLTSKLVGRTTSVVPASLVTTVYDHCVAASVSLRVSVSGELFSPATTTWIATL